MHPEMYAIHFRTILRVNHHSEAIFSRKSNLADFLRGNYMFWSTCSHVRNTRTKNRNMPHFFPFSLAKPAIPNDFQWEISVTNYGYQGIALWLKGLWTSWLQPVRFSFLFSTNSWELTTNCEIRQYMCGHRRLKFYLFNSNRIAFSKKEVVVVCSKCRLFAQKTLENYNC